MLSSGRAPPEPGTPQTPRRPADAVALARTLRRLGSAGSAPWLHGEVARRMVARLALIKQPPRRVLDWAAPLGGSAGPLRAALPVAEVQAALPAGIDAPTLPRGWLDRWNRWRGGPSPLPESALAPRSAELLWSNMGLHFSADPPRLFARWRELIALDGFLMFSTLGPGSLRELADLYRAEGFGGPPMAPLVDMHDLGDMLVHAGFADPVMDQETLTLTWPDAPALLAELRTLGANVHPARPAGLRTPRWLRRLHAALEARRNADGRIALTFEVVYGHAFCPPPKARVQGETRIDAGDLQAMARRGRASGAAPGRG